jgi:hypothetical protein
MARSVIAVTGNVPPIGASDPSSVRASIIAALGMPYFTQNLPQPGGSTITMVSNFAFDTILPVSDAYSVTQGLGQAPSSTPVTGAGGATFTWGGRLTAL